MKPNMFRDGTCSPARKPSPGRKLMSRRLGHRNGQRRPCSHSFGNFPDMLLPHSLLRPMSSYHASGTCFCVNTHTVTQLLPAIESVRINESNKTNRSYSSLSFVSFVLRLDSSQTHFSLTRSSFTDCEW